MVGLRFSTEPEAQWVSGADTAFDSTELGLYTKEERGKVRFLIMPYTPKDMRRMREEQRKKQERDTDVAMRMAQDLGIQRPRGMLAEDMNDDILDHVLHDWEGVLDAEGNEMPCTRENKVMLANGGYPMLAGKWIDVARWLMARKAQEKEAELKNSETSQDG